MLHLFVNKSPDLWRRATPRTSASIGRFVFSRLVNFFFCTLYLAQTMIQAFGHGHAFVAGNQQLARVLLPCVERALFLFLCKRLIFCNFSGRLVVIFRLLNFLGLHGGILWHGGSPILTIISVDRSLTGKNGHSSRASNETMAQFRGNHRQAERRSESPDCLPGSNAIGNDCFLVR